MNVRFELHHSDGGGAELAIDLAHEDGSTPAVPAPCQILDARLRPVGTSVADGRPYPVPAGRLVLLITLSRGDARRISVMLRPGGTYRLHVHGLQPSGVAELADAEAAQTMRLLDAGRIADAVTLANRRLPAIEEGELDDPVAITAVAYALVQASDRTRLGTWCLDLADRHPRMSDGFVIGAEWHALAGNHLTALSYLRRLGGAPLPLFAFGVTRALDRLAGYRTLRLNGTPSERLRRKEHSAAPSAGQLLNRWDVEAASALYDELSFRSGRRSPTTVLTEAPSEESDSASAWSRVASFEQKLIQRLASRRVEVRK